MGSSQCGHCPGAMPVAETRLGARHRGYALLLGGCIALITFLMLPSGMRPLHNRMPVILPDGLEEAWMAPADGPGLRALEPLLGGWDPAGWEVVDPQAPAGPRQLSLLG